MTKKNRKENELICIIINEQGLILLSICYSSAKDQLTGLNVAVKKIMKPFSAPVLAKRTYRELKLLKALRHENVCKQKKTKESILYYIYL